MTRAELEHAIRAACDVTGDTEVYVIGSQSILGQFPNATSELRQSMEADIVPKNKPDKVTEIDGSLGEFSRFHETHNFYVHGLSIESSTLPEGWEARLIKIQNENTHNHSGWCIDSHDLAASKLVANRPKDHEFVRTLLREKLVDVQTLISRIEALPIEQTERERRTLWVTSTFEEL